MGYCVGLSVCPADSHIIIARRAPGSEQHEFPLQPLSLLIVHPGTSEEHWFLVIGPYCVSGKYRDENDILGSPLEGSAEIYRKPSGTKSKTYNLKADAKFESALDMVGEVNKISDIVLKVNPTAAEGGICIDFLQDALEMLVKDKKLNAIPKTFTEIKTKEYKGVYERTWGALIKKTAGMAGKTGST